MGQGGLANAGTVLDQQVATRQEAGEGQPDLRTFTEHDALGRGDDIVNGRDRAVGHEIWGKYERENEGAAEDHVRYGGRCP